eukprot:TRINITY_DN1786_c0_g1_i1.p1 TRINITY_DN1786_c0_g1~~TRINITY_DN1786_c0_g1_i1.p1  ORF type:complete len:365 (+),score=53.60 TRINITY_DN1786_c0_g1_i1:71-1096(+)
MLSDAESLSASLSTSESDSDESAEELALTYAQDEVHFYECKLDTNALVLKRCLDVYGGKVQGGSSLGVCHALVLYCLALGLQLIIMYVLGVEAEELETGLQNRDFNRSIGMTMSEAADCLVSGASEQDVFANCQYLKSPHTNATVYAFVLKTCSEQRIHHPSLYWFMLFLWISTMLTELRDGCEQLDAVYFSASHRSDKLERGVFDEKDEKTVFRVPRTLKFVFAIFFCIPNIIVDIAVGYIGCKLILMQRNSDVDLIVKSLCLAFVTQIDDKMVAAFTSRMSSARFKGLRIRTSILIKRRFGASRGFLLIILCCAVTMFIYFGIFGPLGKFRLACPVNAH